MEKINNSDFIRQVSQKTGYAQKSITEVLNAAADIVLDNLNDNKASTVFKGMIVYPATYKNETTFARARFGKKFRNLAPLS